MLEENEEDEPLHEEEEILERLRAHAAWGKFSLTAAMTINGAAAIAILAFIGNLATSNSHDVKSVVHEMSLSMLTFCLGVAFATISSALAYLGDGVKYMYMRYELRYKKKGIENTYLKGRKFVNWFRTRSIEIGIFVWVLSFLCFFVGVFFAWNGLSSVAYANITLPPSR